jgi:PilZ domain
MVERRRCKRFPFTIPVKVYGRTPRNHPFRDVTATMAVSLYGGLLDMKPRVKLGQKILIVNSFTEEERECRVVSVDPQPRGRRRVAVEFANANADGDFWHVYSPPVPLKAVSPSANPAGHITA